MFQNVLGSRKTKHRFKMIKLLCFFVIMHKIRR
jgi:hypothetical protein